MDTILKEKKKERNVKAFLKELWSTKKIKKEPKGKRTQQWFSILLEEKVRVINELGGIAR